jgi:hypothetical protein
MSPTEPPFIFSCDRCGRPIGEHRIFHDEPPPGHGLSEATFGGLDTSGFYCPPEGDHEWFAEWDGADVD